MNDQHMADIARRLGAALIRRAHDRDNISIAEVAGIQTELCAAYRQEQADAAKVTDETHTSTSGAQDAAQPNP